MARSIIEQVKTVIEEQTVKVGGVGNLYGVIDTSAIEIKDPKPQNWFAFRVTTDSAPSLSQALAQYTYDRTGYEQLDSDAEGKIYFPQGNTPLQANQAAVFLSVARVPAARKIPIKVSAPGYTISVYTGFALSCSGSDQVSTDLRVSQGDTPLLVLVYGGTQPLNVEIAKDVELLRSEPIVAAPNLRTVTVHNIDPDKGSLISRLSWTNEPMASAWHVYRANTTPLGAISAVTSREDAMFDVTLPGNLDLTVGEGLYAQPFPLGVVISVTFTESDTIVTLIPDRRASDTTDDWQNLIVYRANSFESLAYVANVGGSPVVFDDNKIGKDQIYLYKATSFGLFGITESAFSPVEWVFSNDLIAPKGIDWDADNPPVFTQDAGVVTVSYRCPDDPDFSGVTVIQATVTETRDGSGVVTSRTIDETVVHTDFGIAGQKDSFNFPGADFPTTYFLCTFDVLGNRQKISDYYLSVDDPARNAPFKWDYPGPINGATKQPRLINFRETHRSTDTIRFEWVRPQNLTGTDPVTGDPLPAQASSARVDKVYVFTETHSIPLDPSVTNPWPHIDGAGNPVYGSLTELATADLFEIDIPAKGYVTYAQFEPLHIEGDVKTGGEIRRVMVFGVDTGADDMPPVYYQIQVKELGSSTGRLRALIDDPQKMFDRVDFFITEMVPDAVTGELIRQRTGPLGPSRAPYTVDAGDVPVVDPSQVVYTVYECDVTLHDKHSTLVEPVIWLLNGKKITPGAETFDINTIPSISDIRVSYYPEGAATKAAILVIGDSDTISLWYEEYNEGTQTWSTATRFDDYFSFPAATPRKSPRAGEIVVDASSDHRRRFRVFAKNSDGTESSKEQVYVDSEDNARASLTWEIKLSENLASNIGTLEIWIHDPLNIVDELDANAVLFDRVFYTGANRFNQTGLMPDSSNPSQKYYKKSVPLHNKHSSTISPIIITTVTKADNTLLIVRPGAETFDVNSTAEIVHLAKTGYIPADPDDSSSTPKELWTIVGDSDCHSLWRREEGGTDELIVEDGKAVDVEFPQQGGYIRRWYIYGKNVDGVAGPEVVLGTFDDTTLTYTHPPAGDVTLEYFTVTDSQLGSCAAGTSLVHTVAWKVVPPSPSNIVGVKIQKYGGLDQYGYERWDTVYPVGLSLGADLESSFDFTHTGKVEAVGGMATDTKYKIALTTMAGGMTGTSWIATHSNYLFVCGGSSGPVYGCTDPGALNYNATATADDGTCRYSSGGGGRGAFTDSDGV